MRDWCKVKASLEQLPKAKRVCCEKLAKYLDLEKKLVDWICSKRSNGHLLTMLQIQMQALKYSDNASFKASTGWTQRFMKRHGLALCTKTKIAEKLADDSQDKIISFHKFVMNLRKEHQFDIKQIGNMDKIPMRFDLPLNQTIDSKGKISCYNNRSS